MRWGDFRRSDNVEDRGDDGGSGGGFPGGGGIRLTGGVIVVVVVASLLFGADRLQVLSVLTGEGGPAPPPRSAPQGYGPAPTRPAAHDQTKEMVARVLGDTEDVWGAVFKTMGSRYEPPRLVLFRGATQ